MATFKARLPRRRTVFQVISISVVVVLVLIAILALYVYKQSVGKFEIRRLSLPTRIFTDFTPLRTGIVLGPDDLAEKLNRLGYRQVPAIAQAGDYVPGSAQIDIYTRPFTHPTGQYPSQPVRVAFRNGGIASVVSLKQAAAIENAALEPELLTSILSDQLENRRPVTLDQVPKSLQDAVVATEDVRFWHHPGVDPIGLFRALFRNVRAGGVTEGGSTLTQQLVKNYYLTGERTYKRKVTEAFMAVILDAKYSKREILEAYLNDIYLGRNRSISILGVGEAARFYFGKPVAEITLPEAALLAGMIRSPNNYSPFVRPDLAMQRRSTVLGLMLSQKKISRAEYDAAMAAKLPPRPFRQRSGLSSIPYYVDRVLQEMARDYGIKDVKGRGLQIYTAIDLAAQDTAARTVEAGLAALEKGSRRLRRPGQPLQGAIVHVDVPTGEIRALIGGRNYDLNQFNRALNAKRQIGSLVKPFVYATAFEPSLSNQNITPATLVSDTRFVLKRRFSADWSPRNYEDVYHQTVTVAEALEQSLNSASVRIGLACGLDPIARTAHTLGVVTDIDTKNPSMLLGAVNLSPVEMADAFSTIARIGSRVPLHAVKFVTDDKGRLVSAGDEIKPVQVFPARDMYMLVTVMKGVVDRGTAGGARSMGFRLTAAGKTGTTNDKRDAWFIGFTPKALTLTWLGFDDNAPTGLSGGTGAVPIWTRFMQAVMAGQPNVDFAPPEGVVTAQIDETSGGLAVPNCPTRVVVTEAFKTGTQPGNPCPLHSPQAAPAPAVDQFGNPIALDTAGMPVTPETTTTAEPLPPITPEPGDNTLTGGYFRTDTAPPTTTTTTSTEPRRERDLNRNRSDQPPPSTDTSAPPSSTSSTSTSPPPR
ncbi:MAG TPA: PBP1A family penicillin-binding protein [Thermoanaerobaculia bacterium]|jgi:penicillin-binding protein 1B|nr:PBP1A family penicillin-binding protein [Thermoanaerobaculia bacterium]